MPSFVGATTRRDIDILLTITFSTQLTRLASRLASRVLSPISGPSPAFSHAARHATGPPARPGLYAAIAPHVYVRSSTNMDRDVDFRGFRYCHLAYLCRQLINTIMSLACLMQFLPADICAFRNTHRKNSSLSLRYFRIFVGFRIISHI